MSTPRNNVEVAFDAYGTLLSTESIAEKLTTHFGAAKAQTIAATWQKYQLDKLLPPQPIHEQQKQQQQQQQQQPQSYGYQLTDHTHLQTNMSPFPA
ncbi:uncharacterized protein IWZ02DRAFT_496874 [Phyllosticta citriasiana]|uniref:uncharacterized protein n=1 Tax=Phyllosticta citriasiana TaxID=595635 RepID=UPI0030FD7C20